MLIGYFIGKKVASDNWVNILGYAMNKYGNLELTVLSDTDFWTKLLSEWENETLRKIKA